ncbi:MAG TPA: nuclear transport factor 2 family protein [Blastocatellia bacterium]|nr:nuclear transport factor 2 family protein [Blastocatellia bacterium]
MKRPITAEQVLDEHPELSRSGNEEDFLKSYREDSFILMPDEVRRGLGEIRDCFRALQQRLPNARFTYKVRIVEQDVGLVEWSADSDTNTVTDGADSYVIRDGYIRAQTIHYTLVPKKNS